MKSPAADAPDLAAPPADDATVAFVTAEVDAVLDEVASGLGARDLAWLREKLIAEALADAPLSRLVSAAAPRNVDASGEVPRSPTLAASPSQPGGALRLAPPPGRRPTPPKV
ncbi:MAG: hypothetical protein U0271_27125 [Polyangiaceae bacterium]